MNCEQALALVSAQLDREIDADDRTRLEAHLAVCPACGAAAESLQQQDGAIRRAFVPLRRSAGDLEHRIIAGLPSQPMTPRQRAGRPAVRAAVMAASLAALAVLLHGWQPVPSVRKAASESRGKAPAEPGDEPRAALRPVPISPAAPDVSSGAMIQTRAGERRRLVLPDGSLVFVNEQTSLHVDADRQLTLSAGEVYLEVAAHSTDGERGTFVVRTPRRSVAALGTKFAVQAADQGTGIVVTQGRVRVSGTDQIVAAGQQLKPGSATIAAAPRISAVLDWTRDLMAAAESPLVPRSAYCGGALVAVDPFGQEARLSLRKYRIDVHIEDGFARTTIDQTYFNRLTERLEGTFHFPLPADASLSRLAMYVANGDESTLMEGGMAERDYARDVFEQIRYTRRDPALLEWVDGSTFKMRVFPLEGRQEKRIILSYTQKLDSLYGYSGYRFPSGHSLQIVGDWSFHARVKNAAGTPWSSTSHELKASNDGKDLVLDAQAKNSKPEKDVVLRLADTSNAAGDSVRYSRSMHDGNQYLMLRYRPALATQAAKQRRDWVFLFEASGDRDPVVARAQIDVVKTLLENAEHDDTFSILTANTRVSTFAKETRAATPENIKAAVDWLEKAHLIGALDLGQGLEMAKPIVKNGKNPVLVHVGSGVATIGERREDVLAKVLPDEVPYVGVGVGKRWSRNLMKLAAERSGGAFTQINPDEPIGWRTFELSAMLNTPRLLNIKVVDNAEKVKFLTFTTTIAQGEELCAIARIDPTVGTLPESVTVAGMLDKKAFTQTFAVQNVADKADYLPRTWAKLEIDRLLGEVSKDAEGKTKKQIIDLSKAMYVMTPYTSLLVLENEAMYQQFKVDRGRKDHWARYDCPPKLPTVYEPETGKTVDRRIRNEPSAGNGSKPAAEQVLATIVVRVPAEFFAAADANAAYTPAVNVLQLLGGAYAVPQTVPGAGGAPWLPGFLPERTSLVSPSFIPPMATGIPSVVPMNSFGIPRNTGFLSNPINFHQYSQTTGVGPIRGATRIYNTFGTFYFTNGSGGGGGFGSTAAFSSASPTMGMGGFGLPRTGLAFNGDPPQGVLLHSNFANMFFPNAQGMGPSLNAANAGSFDPFRSSWNLSPSPPVSSAALARMPAAAKFLGILRHLPAADGAETAEVLLARMVHGSGGGALLYRRPGFGGDERLLFDLVAHASAMNTTPADVRAILEAEAKAEPADAPGKVDEAAAQLIDQARQSGWQQVTGATGLQGTGLDESCTIVLNGAGQFRNERILPSGLREIAVCDGQTLIHLYPELGIGARRSLSRFHRAELSELVPWVVPPVEDLARGHDIQAIGRNMVRLVARDGTGKPPAERAVELVFHDGRLTERRVVEMPSGDLVRRTIYGADGKVTSFRADGTILAERLLRREAAAAPDLKPNTKELVVLPLPYRTPEHVAKAIDNGNPNVPAGAALAIFTAYLWQRPGDAQVLWQRQFHARGVRSPGFLTLLAAAGINIDSLRATVGMQAGQAGPLEKYLAHASDPSKRLHVPLGLHGGPKEGFVQQLAAFHDRVLPWHTGRALTGDAAHRTAERDRALDYVRRNPTVYGWALLNIVRDQLADDPAFQAVLTDALQPFARVPGLAYAARYETARALLDAGRRAEARTLFGELYESACTMDHDPPRIDTAFRQALRRNGDDEPDLFRPLLRQTATQRISQQRRMAVVALAWQCRQLDDVALADELLDLALAQLPDAERLPVTLAGVEYLWQAGQKDRADDLLQRLLQEERHGKDPSLWRLAARLTGPRQLKRQVECLDRALELEYHRLPALIDLQGVRDDYGRLLNGYQQMASALGLLGTSPPPEFTTKVVRAADRWRSLDSDPTAACHAAARILKDAGAKELAWDYLTTPTALRPNEPAPQLALARTLRSDGDYDLADQAYALAFEGEPTNAELLFERAQMLQQAGKPDNARQLYRRIAAGTWQPRFSGIQQQARVQVGLR